MRAFNLKLSVFTFVSAIICYVGYYFLYAEPLVLIKDALFLCAYISFFVWISEIIACRVRYSINVTISILSFVLAVYLGAYMNFVPYEFLREYCFYAFYLLTVVCIISVIVLIGRIIFVPQKRAEPSTSNISALNVEDTVETDAEENK